jgi:hypothetical protein
MAMIPAVDGNFKPNVVAIIIPKVAVTTVFIVLNPIFIFPPLFFIKM